MRKNGEIANVKRDYLIRLARLWYRVDTNSRRIARFARASATQRRFSRAKSEATLSRARTSTASPRSIITSHGRGREL